MWSISRQDSDLGDPSVTICSICKFYSSAKRGLFVKWTQYSFCGPYVYFTEGKSTRDLNIYVHSLILEPTRF